MRQAGSGEVFVGYGTERQALVRKGQAGGEWQGSARRVVAGNGNAGLAGRALASVRSGRGRPGRARIARYGRHGSVRSGWVRSGAARPGKVNQ